MSAPSQLSDGSLILTCLSPLPSSSNQSRTHTKCSHPSHSLTHTHTPECSPFLTLGLSRLSGVMSLLIHVRLSAGPPCCQSDAVGGGNGVNLGSCRVGLGGVIRLVVKSSLKNHHFHLAPPSAPHRKSPTQQRLNVAAHFSSDRGDKTAFIQRNH